MSSVTPTYNYTATNEGAFTKFSYKQTPFPWKMIGPMCFFTFLPAAYFTFLWGPESITSGLIILIIWMLALSAITVFLINLLFRKQKEFRISDTEIEINGKHYDRKHVSSYFVKTPSGEATHTTIIQAQHLPTSVAAGLHNTTQAIGNARNEMALKIKAALKESSYKICIRFGAKDIDLATGLGETDADVLFNKIVEVARLE